MKLERKYRIHRTNKLCQLQDQQVYAEYIDKEGRWKIHNVKGKPFEIPANKLYHPMAKFFENPNNINWIITKIKVRYWERKYRRVYKKFSIRELTSFKIHTETFGIFVTLRKGKHSEYYFQYRKEDFKKFKDFVGQYKY